MQRAGVRGRGRGRSTGLCLSGAGSAHGPRCPSVDGADLLEAIVELALEEARAARRQPGRGRRQPAARPHVTVRLGEVETVEYQRDRGLGVTVYFGQRKGSASTADLAPAAVRETVAKACGDRALHRRGRLRRPRRSATCSRATIPDLELDHPWADRRPRRPSSMARACEAAGAARSTRASPIPRARRVTTHRGVRVYGNTHRLPRRLSQHQPHAQLRRCSARRRRHAARLLVFARARSGARSRAPSAVGPSRRRARRGAPRRAAPRHAQGAGAVRARGRARPGRPLRRRDPRRQPVPSRLLPARRRGPAGASRLSADVRAAAPAGALASAPSTPRASPRATASW